MGNEEWSKEMNYGKKTLPNPNRPSSSRLPEDSDTETDELTRDIRKLCWDYRRDRQRNEEMQSRKKKVPDLNYSSSSRLPKEFERKIIKNCGGIKPSSITRVIQKPLTKSDTVKRNGKVTMPYNQVESLEFLTEEERENLGRGKKIEVLLIRKSRKNGVIETKLQLVQSNHKTKSERPLYALRVGWNKVVSDDELKEGDIVQIWAYRNALNMMLCMVLVKRESDEEGQQPTTEESNDDP